MLTQPISSTSPTAPSSASKVVCTFPTSVSRAGISFMLQPASAGYSFGYSLRRLATKVSNFAWASATVSSGLILPIAPGKIR
jgi:hypothetical protein